MFDITSKIGVISTLINVHHVLGLKLRNTFIECPRIVRVWDFFAPFLSRLLGSPLSLSFTSVLFPLSMSQSSPRLLLFRYLIASILYYIWQARNSTTFRNSHLTFQAIVDLIRKNIRLRILGEPFDKVKYFWSLDGIFCSTDANFFSFEPLGRLHWLYWGSEFVYNDLIYFDCYCYFEPFGRLHW